MTTSAFRLVSPYRDAFDDAEWLGFIVGNSDALVMIHRVSDSYSLDGYRVFRRTVITDMQDDFLKRALVEDALRLTHQHKATREFIEAYRHERRARGRRGTPRINH